MTKSRTRKIIRDSRNNWSAELLFGTRARLPASRQLSAKRDVDHIRSPTESSLLGPSRTLSHLRPWEGEGQARPRTRFAFTWIHRRYKNRKLPHEPISNSRKTFGNQSFTNLTRCPYPKNKPISQPANLLRSSTKADRPFFNPKLKTPNPKPSDFGPEIINRLHQPLGQIHFRLPLQNLLRLRDVRPALFGIVLRQRLENNFALRTRHPNNLLRELQHRHLRGVPDIHRQIIIAHHQPINPLNQIRHITKAARLPALAEHRHRLVLQRLAHKRRHHPPVIQ